MFKLAATRGSLEGAHCDEDGLYLGSAALIARRPDGSYRIRADDQIAELLAAAYDPPPDLTGIVAGLRKVAAALEQRDLTMATIAALQLQLGEISDEGIACVVLADSLLKYNFDPNEPRDWHGRWTSEGAGGTPVPQSGPSGRRPRATPNDAAGASDPAPTSPQTITGSATYYNLVGRRMANGQMFDPGAMNAAMLKIPFGTVVTVTLAEDRSRSIKVTITDRGPYGPGRVIDLTEAAFKALVGSTRRGIVKVIVTVP